MSYTTPYIRIDGEERGKHNLKQATSDLMRAFFSQKYENTFYLPLSLRLGRKTFEAGKKLFIDKSLLFDDVWKTKYLLGDNLENNYHDFWGLLAKIWPREKAKIYSDLFGNIRYKIRIILLFNLIYSPEYKNLLASYILRHITTDYHRNITEYLLKIKWQLKRNPALRDINSSLRAAALQIAPVISQNFAKLNANNLDSDFNFLATFSEICSQLQFLAMWAPEQTYQFLLSPDLILPDNKNINKYLAYRARVRGIHCLNNQDLWNLSINEHLAGVEDKKQGDAYILYSSICNNQINYQYLKHAQKPEYLQELWKSGLIKNVIYNYIHDMYQPWRLGLKDQTRYILIIISAMRSIKDFKLNSREKNNLVLAVKNALRYFYKYKERNKEKIYQIKNSQKIISWIKRLEKFTNCRHW